MDDNLSDENNDLFSGDKLSQFFPVDLWNADASADASSF